MSFRLHPFALLPMNLNGESEDLPDEIHLSSVILQPSSALRLLETYRFPTCAEAVDYLAGLLANGQFLELFQHYFPRKFARARRAHSLRQMAREFLDLVDKRLFPIYEWVLDEIEPGERLDFIPVAQANPYEPWNYDDEEGWPLPARVMLGMLLGSAHSWEEIEAKVGMKLPRPLVAGDEQAHDWEAFLRRCREAGGRMAHVPTALELIAHDTGNFWLDFSEEGGWAVDFTWNVETMDSLAEEWRRAQDIVRGFNRTLAWLEAKPQRLTQMIALWNECRVQRVQT